jgi:manganese transport protein
MTVAGLANISLVVFSADLPAAAGVSLEAAHEALGARAGEVAAALLAVALLASGLAATLVGVQTGDVVMQGFIRRPMPTLVRRLVAVVPCLVVLGLGVNATTALIWSQVILSFALPGTLIPLLLFTGDRTLMGVLANRPVTTAVAAAITAVIAALCGFLLVAG